MFKFKMPENLEELDRDALEALLTDADADITDVLAMGDEELTKEVLDSYDEIVAGRASVAGRVADLDAEETSLEERRAAMRAAAEEPADATDEEPEGDDGDEGEEDPAEADADAEIEEKEPVMASARRSGGVAKAARRAPAPKADTRGEGGAQAGVADGRGQRPELLDRAVARHHARRRRGVRGPRRQLEAEPRAR